MRGALTGLLYIGQGEQGIIPADAGSTVLSHFVEGNRKDHPRGCGEHIAVKQMYQGETGSSPRMRGARPQHRPMGHVGGIIPADAGSTDSIIQDSLLYEDHPRGCGEHSSKSQIRLLGPGSSPRMRGARGSVGGAVGAARIIPADAGST